MMKSHRIQSAITGFIALLGIATAAYAQSAAEIGAMHNNCNHPNYQGDRSRCGGGNRAPVSAEVWENSFGAVARGYGDGLAGVIEGAKSEREARKIALSRCTQAKCEIVSLVKNGCQAVASSDDKSGYGRAENEQDAINMALQNCLKLGGQCDIGYSGCSLPVRVK